jgi:hypothetical protein
MRDTYGRIPVFSPTTILSQAGIPGAVLYDGHGPKQCNCYLSHNYPYAFAPRLGAAYQINSKTVFRAGFGIVYKGTAQNNQADTQVASAAGGATLGTFGSAVTTLTAGYPSQFNPRQWPTNDQGFFPTAFPIPGPARLSSIPTRGGRRSNTNGARVFSGK